LQYVVRFRFSLFPLLSSLIISSFFHKTETPSLTDLSHYWNSAFDCVSFVFQSSSSSQSLFHLFHSSQFW
jgi:hypothetical protein